MKDDTLVIFGPARVGKSLIANTLIGERVFYRSVRSAGHWGHTASHASTSDSAMWRGTAHALGEEERLPCDEELARNELVWLDSPMKSSRCRWNRVTEMSIAPVDGPADKWAQDWWKRVKEEWARTHTGLLIVPNHGLAIDDVRQLRAFKERISRIESVPLYTWVSGRNSDGERKREEDVAESVSAVFGEVPTASVYPGKYRRRTNIAWPSDEPWKTFLS